MATWKPGDQWDPGNPENRERTRPLKSALRQRLMDWDPIGVGDAPEAQDEYDNYLSPLLHMLHDRRSPDEIAAYLIDVVENRMGMGSVPGDAERQLATELVRWWADTTGS